MKKLLCVLLCVIMLMGSTVSIMAQGNTDDSEVDIGDILGVSQVTFNKGTEKWTQVYDRGADIEYPVLEASRETDNAWSLSDSNFVAVPLKAEKSLISVFYYENPVISFENYYQDSVVAASMAVQPSSDIAYSGNKSLKIRNSYFSVLSAQPDDWADNFNNYYHLADGVFLKNSFEEAPDFEGQPYYRIRKGQDEHSVLLGSISPSVTYKLTFKYYVAEALKTSITLKAFTGDKNLWASGDSSNPSENGLKVKYDDSVFTVNSDTAVGVWHTGVMYFKASEYAVNWYNKLYLLTGAHEYNTYDVVYIDDISVSETDITPSITYHYNNGTEDLTITSGVTAGMELGFDSIPTAPANRYFMGWYSDAEYTQPINSIKVPTVPVDDKLEAHAYARWGEYSASYDMSYENYENPDATGYGYMLDGTYRNSITEGGWATLEYNEDGIAFSKNAKGQARHFNPEKKDGLAQYDGTGYITDAAFGEDTHEIGEITNVGWGVFNSLTLKDKDGNMFVAKPDTTYTAVVTYKVTGQGDSSFRLTAGRPYEYVDSGADGYTYDTFSTAYSNNISLKDHKASDEYLTAMTTLTTNDFADSVPVLSLYAVVSGYRAQRVAADDNGVASYTYTDENGVAHTVYPYKPLSVPEFVIKEITLIEVQDGNSAIAYNYYTNGEGFTAELAQGASMTPVTHPQTDSVDNYWYKDIVAYDRYESSLYPTDNTMLYNANYLLSHVNEQPGGYSAYTYSGAKGLNSVVTQKDGKIVNALNYNL